MKLTSTNSGRIIDDFNVPFLVSVVMSERECLGSILNDAIRIKPSVNMAEPKAFHITLAEQFWEHLACNHDSVVAELNHIMNFLLTESKRETQMERAIWFVSFCFCEMLRSTDEARRSSAHSFLNILTDRSRCENKTVRFRSCQFIRTVLDNVPEGLELDADLAETLYSTLLTRCEDRNQEVRSQALYALDRFKIPGDHQQYKKCQVTQLYYKTLARDPHPGPRSAALNCLPLTRRAIKMVCGRTRDESELVRLTAVKVVAWSLPPDLLGVELANKVVHNAFEDRSELIVRLCQEMVVSWFIDHAKEDLKTFFSFFSPRTYPAIYPKIMEALIKKKPTRVIQAAKKLVESMTVGMEESTERDVVMWRTLLCGFKFQADQLGLESAAHTTQSQTLMDLIDLALPQTVKEVCEWVTSLLSQEQYFHCGQVLEILIHCCNFVEEADRESASKLYTEMCSKILKMEVKERHLESSRVLVFGKHLFSDIEAFLQTTMAFLEENKTPQTEQDNQCHYCWCSFAFEMLQTLPPRLRNSGSLGTITFQIRDLLALFSKWMNEVPDTDPSKGMLVRGIGGVLSLEMTEQNHQEHLPLIWQALEGPYQGPVIAAIEAVSTLAMVYGIRKTDQLPASPVLSRPLPDIWSHDCTQSLDQSSLPLRVFNLLESNVGSKGPVQVAIVQTLCKFLTMSQFQGRNGMNLVESVQCLSSLIQFFSLNPDSDKHRCCIRQPLRIFFDRFCRVHIFHQYLLRAGFLPILHNAMSKSKNLKKPANSAVVKLLTNLLKAPVQSTNSENEDEDLRDKELHKWNTQFVCLLLWEVSQCPTTAFSRQYITAIWKLILDFKLEDYEGQDRIIISTVLQHLQTECNLQGKNFETLKSRLRISELQTLSDSKKQDLVEKVENYMKQFGGHPLLDEY